MEETSGIFRKKPVQIEAQRVPVYDQYDDVTRYLSDAVALADWCGGLSFMMHSEGDGGENHIAIHTLEGDMRALPGDWIIQGVHGDFYPCKSDIFDATYDYVGPTPSGLSRQMNQQEKQRRSDAGQLAAHNRSAN